ncbi:hypothetical protein PsorP6_000832 [Peronosclerospora sorghi]|uniref:Uncharacterized protein n=1 Tax=Peronosclerospora sorghi TaxID=230839 RepID=A0ACC0WQW3_9STRA|nr:hypothetical protein PsorP6_000832 [Peronosclerospora sorghi]
MDPNQHQREQAKHPQQFSSTQFPHQQTTSAPLVRHRLRTRTHPLHSACSWGTCVVIIVVVIVIVSLIRRLLALQSKGVIRLVLRSEDVTRLVLHTKAVIRLVL